MAIEPIIGLKIAKLCVLIVMLGRLEKEIEIECPYCETEEADDPFE